MVGRAACLTGLLLAAVASAQTIYTYIGQVTDRSVLIAWGTADGRGFNTIGRDSKPIGEASVRVAGRTLPAEKNWLEVTGLQPDTVYPYEIDVNGKRVGGSVVRTWPSKAAKLVFFVIGDFGNGSSAQRAIADAMLAEYRRRAQTPDPVRFVITVGDNIYSNVNLAYFQRGSGAADRDWAPKFYGPYKSILEQIPFLPTLGNHDGNASESRGDLVTYLDNFFFPGNRPARWYRFDYGGLAEFFALDSTENSLTGHPTPAFAPDGEQSKWLASALSASRTPWKIPYFHHPPFNAGPGHGSSYGVLRHWVDLFAKSGVKVVFTGHEHNYQFSTADETTGGARYIVSGAGGELRGGNISSEMQRAHIAGFAPVHHFLVVEIDGSAMRITPLSTDKVVPRDSAGRPLPTELEIR